MDSSAGFDTDPPGSFARACWGLLRLKKGVLAMLQIGPIVWGVGDVARAIEFWCAALSYVPLRVPDHTWAILVPVRGDGPQLALDKHGAASASQQPPNHLDLYADDQAAEVDRLLALGALRVQRDYPANADFIVLADPDGNRFCVVEKAGS
jgi:catechol 2,3-dioxygenase-like lactoylglutathione lyase family enzyme